MRSAGAWRHGGTASRMRTGFRHGTEAHER